MLLPIEHKGFRRAGDSADLSVPERLSCGRIPGDEILTVVSEEHPAGRGKKAAAAAGNLVPPGDLSRLVVDRVDESAPIEARAPAGSAETHRTARVGIHEVADSKRILLVDIEQAGIWREGWRRIVGHIAIDE